MFFNTYEGARSVDRDQINAAKLMGASDLQITMTVVIPSTMSWVFASLTPIVSFSLIGVIVGEFIGADKGLGKIIIESESTMETADMMVSLFVLMIEFCWPISSDASSLICSDGNHSILQNVRPKIKCPILKLKKRGMNF